MTRRCAAITIDDNDRDPAQSTTELAGLLVQLLGHGLDVTVMRGARAWQVEAALPPHHQAADGAPS